MAKQSTYIPWRERQRRQAVERKSAAAHRGGMDVPFLLLVLLLKKKSHLST